MLRHPYVSPACLPVLRRWVRDNVDATEDVVFGAEMVCTELVSNALDHAGGRAGEVRLSHLPHGLIIEVDDTDRDGQLTPGTSRLGRNRGRGLTLIGTFAYWGVRRTTTGKTVWARVKAGGR